MNVFFLTLRLLAVYFGTAMAILYFAHRWVRRVPLSVGIFLSLAPLLLVGRALITSGVYAPLDIAYRAPPLSAHADLLGTMEVRTPALGDVVYQMIPFRKAVREAVKNRRLPLWDRFILGGEPLLAAQQPAALHPATWIGFLLPLAQAWTFEMALRFFLALLSGYLFLRDVSCGALLLLGLRRIARERSGLGVALTVVGFLLIVTAGHPETLLHSVAAGGIYFVYELAVAGRGNRLRPALLSFAAGITAFGLCAVLLLPMLEALPHTQEHFLRRGYYAHVHKSVPIQESFQQLLPTAMPYVFGISGKGKVLEGFLEPSSYAGSTLWPLLVLGLLGSKRERYLLLAIGSLGILMRSHFPIVTDAVSALPFFDIALNERMAFYGSFATAALAALGAEKLAQEGSRRGLIAAAAGALLLLITLGLANAKKVPGDMPPSYLSFRFLAQLVPLVLLAALGFAFSSRRFGQFALGAILLILLTQRNLEEGRLYPTYPSRAFFPHLESVSKIPRDVPARMTAVGFTFLPNIAALYEIEDVRGYEAMTFRPLFETYPLWCVHQPVWFNRVDDPTKPFLSFLNVRYVLAPPGFTPPAGWRTLFEGSEGLLLENPMALPRAFVPRSFRCESDGSRRVALLQEIQDFGEKGVVDKCRSPIMQTGDWRANGHASVEVQSYRPDQMTLSIKAIEPSLVATSVTAWPGWKLELDGSKSELVGYNHAFLSFRVPPGRHTAVLRYWPSSFAAGLAISAATLSALVLLQLFRRRRQRAVRQPPKPTLDRL